MKTDWPPLSNFTATVGRLATAEDTRAGRAVFLLNADGIRIGLPIDMPLPCFAWYVDRETGERRKCVVIQAEEADQKRYFGGQFIDEDNQVVGFDTDFDLAPHGK